MLRAVLTFIVACFIFIAGPVVAHYLGIDPLIGLFVGLVLAGIILYFGIEWTDWTYDNQPEPPTQEEMRKSFSSSSAANSASAPAFNELPRNDPLWDVFRAKAD